jgi:hypothetical protein
MAKRGRRSTSRRRHTYSHLEIAESLPDLLAQHGHETLVELVCVDLADSRSGGVALRPG